MRNQSEIDSSSLIDPATPLLTREYWPLTSNNQHQALVNLSGFASALRILQTPPNQAAEKGGHGAAILLRQEQSSASAPSNFRPHKLLTVTFTAAIFAPAWSMGWSCHQTPDSKDLGWLHVQGLRLVSKKLAGNSRDPMISIYGSRIHFAAYHTSMASVWQALGTGSPFRVSRNAIKQQPGLLNEHILTLSGVRDKALWLSLQRPVR